MQKKPALSKSIVLKDVKCIFAKLINPEAYKGEGKKKYSITCSIEEGHGQSEFLTKTLSAFKDAAIKHLDWVPSRKEPFIQCPFQTGEEFNEDKAEDKRLVNIAWNIKAKSDRPQFVLYHRGAKVNPLAMTREQADDLNNEVGTSGSPFFLGTVQIKISTYSNDIGKGITAYIEGVKFKERAGGITLSSDFFDEEDFDADYDAGNKPTSPAPASESDDDDLPF